MRRSMTAARIRANESAANSSVYPIVQTNRGHSMLDAIVGDPVNPIDAG